MIQVLHPGIYSSIQDKGRIGYFKYGVPVGGALDSYSHQIGNILLKNSSSCASIEITFGGAKFLFLKDTFICLTGADFSPMLQDQSIEMMTVYEVKKGTILSFGNHNYGVRTYLAVQGGFLSEVVLKSRSFGSGLTQNIRLQKGNTIPYSDKKPYGNRGFSKMKQNDFLFDLESLECFPGPEYELLTTSLKQKLLESFSISEHYNRVGYQLKETLSNDLPPIITSSVLPGTVQLTPSGTLIILMRDCQVTGGYPRVLQLHDFAICQLSQKMLGKKVNFVLKK